MCALHAAGPEPGGVITWRQIAPESAARLAIITPSHQYPAGVTLALERRVALLEWARRARVVLVEDDYDGDLRLEGQPLEALRGLDDRDEVIYLGTFAKALYPAVRLAFAVLPRWLVEPVARARAASDRHPRWSPDSKKVSYFLHQEQGEKTDLYYIDVTSGKPAVLVGSEQIASMKPPVAGSRDDRSVPGWPPR